MFLLVKKVSEVLTDGGFRSDFIYDLRKCLSWDNVVAFGEVGVDLNTNLIPLETQESALIELLKEIKNEILDLPVVLHCRNSRGWGSFSEYDPSLSTMNIVETVLGNARSIYIMRMRNQTNQLYWVRPFPAFSVQASSDKHLCSCSRLYV